jgi:hypothetical protein
MVVDQPVDSLAGNLYEIDRAGGMLRRNEGRGVPDDQQTGVNRPATERGDSLIRSQLYWFNALFIAPAEVRLDGVPCRPGAGTLAANIYPTPCEIREDFDMGIRAGDNGYQLRIKRRY